MIKLLCRLNWVTYTFCSPREFPDNCLDTIVSFRCRLFCNNFPVSSINTNINPKRNRLLYIFFFRKILEVDLLQDSPRITWTFLIHTSSLTNGDSLIWPMFCCNTIIRKVLNVSFSLKESPLAIEKPLYYLAIYNLGLSWWSKTYLTPVCLKK
jgi:hypothetical protein